MIDARLGLINGQPDKISDYSMVAKRFESLVTDENAPVPHRRAHTGGHTGRMHTDTH